MSREKASSNTQQFMPSFLVKKPPTLIPPLSTSTRVFSSCQKYTNGKGPSFQWRLRCTPISSLHSHLIPQNRVFRASFMGDLVYQKQRSGWSQEELAIATNPGDRSLARSSDKGLTKNSSVACEAFYNGSSGCLIAKAVGQGIMVRQAAQRKKGSKRFRNLAQEVGG